MQFIGLHCSYYKVKFSRTAVVRTLDSYHSQFYTSSNSCYWWNILPASEGSLELLNVRQTLTKQSTQKKCVLFYFCQISLSFQTLVPVSFLGSVGWGLFFFFFLVGSKSFSSSIILWHLAYPYLFERKLNSSGHFLLSVLL